MLTWLLSEKEREISELETESNLANKNLQQAESTLTNLRKTKQEKDAKFKGMLWGRMFKGFLLDSFALELDSLLKSALSHKDSDDACAERDKAQQEVMILKE